MRYFKVMICLSFLLFVSETNPVFAVNNNSEKIEKVLTQEKLDETLKLNKVELEKEILKSKLEILEKEKGVLEGNLSNVISFFGIIIAALSVVFVAVGFWYKKSIEEANERNLGKMDTKLEHVNTTKSDIDKIKENLEAELGKVSDLRVGLDNFTITSNNLHTDINNISNSNKSLINYIEFLEYRIQKSETVYKYFAKLEMKRRLKNEIETILGEAIFDHEKALEAIHASYGEGIVDWNETVNQIVDYYFKELEIEEEKILKQINKKKLTYDRYEFLKDDDDDDLLSDIEIDTHFEEWNQSLKSLENILSILKESIEK